MKQSGLYVSDLPLIPSFENLFFPIGIVAVLFVEAPSHSVFFQNPDDEFPAALLPAFGVLPLPLGSLPLLSDSLPDLCAQMLTLGLLCGISSVNEADLAEDAHLAMLAK